MWNFIQIRYLTLLFLLSDRGTYDDIIQAEISNERGRFKILRDGIELTRSDGVRIKKTEAKVVLTLTTATMDDAGFYQIITNGDESFAELIVEEKPIEFKATSIK